MSDPAAHPALFAQLSDVPYLVDDWPCVLLWESMTKPPTLIRNGQKDFGSRQNANSIQNHALFSRCRLRRFCLRSSGVRFFGGLGHWERASFSKVVNCVVNRPYARLAVHRCEPVLDFHTPGWVNFGKGQENRTSVVGECRRGYR